MTDFKRLCSTCESYSQASYTIAYINSFLQNLNITFVELRYHFEACRPSQTNGYTLSF